MSRSDRAFRALARAQPEVIAGVLAALTPGLLPEGVVPVPDDVAPTQIDALPAEMDADFVARVDDRELLHVECQGYRDAGFEPRTLWYHLGFALRHRGKRRVRTVAIWLTRPPKKHPRHRVQVHDITVKVTTVVLREVCSPLNYRREEPGSRARARTGAENAGVFEHRKRSSGA